MRPREVMQLMSDERTHSARSLAEKSGVRVQLVHRNLLLLSEVELVTVVHDEVDALQARYQLNTDGMSGDEQEWRVGFLERMD